jgi:hypothetical protein
MTTRREFLVSAGAAAVAMGIPAQAAVYAHPFQVRLARSWNDRGLVAYLYGFDDGQAFSDRPYMLRKASVELSDDDCRALTNLELPPGFARRCAAALADASPHRYEGNHHFNVPGT